MNDLSTLLPATREVSLGGGTVTVRGIPLRDVGPLMLRFPVLVSYVSYLAGEAIEAEALLAGAPDAAMAVMAAGLGAPANEEAEARLAEFPLGQQIDVLLAVIDCTLTGNSIRPFLQLVAKLRAAPKPDDAPSQSAPGPNGLNPASESAETSPETSPVSSSS